MGRSGFETGTAYAAACWLFLKNASRSALIWSAWVVRHPVRETWIHLQLGALDNLRRHQARRADRHDLIIVAMKNESWHVELLEVFGEVRFREGLDAVVVGLHSSQHTLQPPLLADAFRNLGAGPVVAVEREA